MIRFVLVPFLAIGLASCNTSYSYFEEETAESEEQDTTAFGALLTMSGMVPEPKSRIEHTPRAPLAIPGSTELPEPNASRTAEDAVNFPVDQDEKERARRKQLKDLSGESAYERDIGSDSGSRRTDAARVRAMRREGGGLRRDNRGAGVGRIDNASGNGSARLSREELKVTISGRSEERRILTEDGKAAPRRNLAQPPARYRTPSDTAALPETGDIKNSEWAKSRLYDVQDRRPARARK